MTPTRRGLLLVGATGVLVSAYIHFYLYFWGGYRGISIDRIAGLDISRSFALNAIAGLVIAELLVLVWWLGRFERVAALLGVLFATGAIGAYVLARTSGLLGFTEKGWTGEAVIAEVAQVTAVVSLVAYLVLATRTPTEADSLY